MGKILILLFIFFIIIPLFRIGIAIYKAQRKAKKHSHNSTKSNNAKLKNFNLNKKKSNNANVVNAWENTLILKK